MQDPTPSLVTRACDPSGGINVTRTVGLVRRVGCASRAAKLARPLQVGEVSHAVLAKAGRRVALRMEGTAQGWLHRAANTSRSQRWKDHESAHGAPIIPLAYLIGRMRTTCSQAGSPSPSWRVVSCGPGEGWMPRTVHTVHPLSREPT
ncbi:hypothetical protein QJS10_CPB20g01442 [Acorus calamus]|uniref:Uncharacterized protein n=1 Tax=Acorus calamus TaxID=4465 RepID=A0AAV9C792_ACOCL|nr:hypothetical protein QJS10_CPB20g01442 [Acorus calamus]